MPADGLAGRTVPKLPPWLLSISMETEEQRQGPLLSSLGAEARVGLRQGSQSGPVSCRRAILCDCVTQAAYLPESLLGLTAAATGLLWDQRGLQV